MLQSRNLDDQTFDQIMDFALGRLPWINARWTDYNAHDPGITLLELMAWYKEMQQFHLNTVTDTLRKKLLKLIGVAPEPPRPACCFIERPEGDANFSALSRLETAQGVPLEILNNMPRTARVAAAYIVGGESMFNVTDILAQPRISVQPFLYGGNETELWIGLDDVIPGPIRLYFELDDAFPVPRNPFSEEAQQPRVIAWELVGAGTPLQVEDETHALSINGYVSFDAPEQWPLTDCGGKGKRLQYIRLRLTDPGCEEHVRISFVSASRFLAVQQETWAHIAQFIVAPERKAAVSLTDAVSLEGRIFAFLRRKDGLKQVECRESIVEGEKRVTVDARGALKDGAPNLMLVCADQLHFQDLFIAATGLPNMTVDLMLGGRTVLKSGLICDTRDVDGQVRPAIWNYVDDLSMCGPGERVFTLDAIKEQLVFGDGEHGAIVPAGESAIFLAPLVLSYCENGNIPEGWVAFVQDGMRAFNTAAVGGTAAQSVQEAAAEFLRKFDAPQKCASEADYEREVFLTPGLRVAAAKAITGYDPDEPAGKSRIPVVTIIAVPYSGSEQPLPDQRFLDAVYARLNALRPICTKVKVIGPRYVPVSVSVQVRAKSRDVADKLKQAAEAYFRLSGERDIGANVVRNDLIAVFMKIEDVYKVERLDLSPLGADCYMSAAGDILVPPNAVAYLRSMGASVL